MLLYTPVVTFVYLKSQTINASKYVDIGTDFMKYEATLPFGKTCFSTTGIFDRAVYSPSWKITVENVAFMAGSSKHGRAFLASVGSKSDTIRRLKGKQEINLKNITSKILIPYISF